MLLPHKSGDSGHANLLKYNNNFNFYLLFYFLF